MGIDLSNEAFWYIVRVTNCDSSSEGDNLDKAARAATVLFSAAILAMFALTTTSVGAPPTAQSQAQSNEPPANAKPGDKINDHGAVVVVPERGFGVGAEVLLADGSFQSVEVFTDSDGKVKFKHWGDDKKQKDDEAGSTEGGSLPPIGSPCTDGAYDRHIGKWNSTFTWYFNAGSTPSNLNVNDTEVALKQSVSNITSARNDCGRGDFIDATQSYGGRTTNGTDIGSDNSCPATYAGTDQVNSVSFGDLTSEKVGYACWWYNASNVMLGADYKLNKIEHGWYTSHSGDPCNNEFSVEAVATHEAGHVFGLSHVAEDTHSSLTMSPIINGRCQNGEATLGLGDMLGFESKY